MGHLHGESLMDIAQKMETSHTRARAHQLLDVIKRQMECLLTADWLAPIRGEILQGAAPVLPDAFGPINYKVVKDEKKLTPKQRSEILASTENKLATIAKKCSVTRNAVKGALLFAGKLQKITQKLIVETMLEHQYSRHLTAEALGIDVNVVKYQMQKVGLVGKARMRQKIAKTIEAYNRLGSVDAAALELNCAPSTIYSHLAAARDQQPAEQNAEVAAFVDHFTALSPPK